MLFTGRSIDILLLFSLVFLSGCEPIQPSRFPMEDGGGPIIRINDIEQYSIEVDEMPQGWTMQKSQPAATNEGLSESWKDPAAALKKLSQLGREGGWYQYFAKPGVMFGTNEIAVSIVVLKNPQMAVDYLEFSHLRDVENVESGEYTSISPVSAPEFGESSTAHFGMRPNQQEGAPKNYGWHEIAFQIHNIAVFVKSYAPESSGTIDEAISVARLIEGKLKQIQ